MVLSVIVSISLLNAYAVPNLSNEKSTQCLPTGKKSANGLELVECCWAVFVKPGTGFQGGDVELYCSECENGGTRGYINCSEPELDYRKAPTTDESTPPKDGKAIDESPQTPPFIKSDQGIVLEDKLDESQQNPSFNGENQETPPSVSKEALSNSDNLDMTFEVQEDNDTNN